MLTKSQIKFLRSQAHGLQATILMGQKGLHESLLEEIVIALRSHELVKIKLVAEDKKAMQTILDKINQHCQSETVLFVGHTASIFKENKKAKQPLLESNR